MPVPAQMESATAKAHGIFTKKWEGKEVKTLPPIEVKKDDDFEDTTEHENVKIAPSVMVETFGGKGNVHLAPDCEIRHAAYIEIMNGDLWLGEASVIGAHCVIQANGGVRIGDGVKIGPGCKIYSVEHPDTAVPFRSAPLLTAPVIIGNNVWIGADVVILAGTVIGDDCIIGAKSLLTKGTVIPDGCKAWGTPAKVMEIRNIPRERQAGEVTDFMHLERYKWAASHLDPSDDILDACCGTGYGSILMAEILLEKKQADKPHGMIIGIDSSDAAIGQAQHRTNEGLPCQFGVGDLMDPAYFDDGLFDKVVALECIEHVMDPHRFISNFWRWLKRGGKLMFSVPGDIVPAYVNPFHVRHYNQASIIDLVAPLLPVRTEHQSQVRDPNREDGDSNPDFHLVALTKGEEEEVSHLTHWKAEDSSDGKEQEEEVQAGE